MAPYKLPDDLVANAIAIADTTAGGGAKAVASSSALLSTSGTAKLTVGGNLNLLGGNIPTGNAITKGQDAIADTVAGTDPGSNRASTFEARVTGDTNLIAGYEVGGSNSAATAELLVSGVIKIFTTKLTLTGSSGSGIFQQTSPPGLLPVELTRVNGDHPPITVNESGAGVKIFQDAGRGDAFIFSGVPPQFLDQLQSGIIFAIESTKNNRTAGFDSDVNLAKTARVDSSKICK